jgi:GTP1/Obg family GTP-binding protein
MAVQEVAQVTLVAVVVLIKAHNRMEQATEITVVQAQHTVQVAVAQVHLMVQLARQAAAQVVTDVKALLTVQTFTGQAVVAVLGIQEMRLLLTQVTAASEVVVVQAVVRLLLTTVAAQH